MKLRLPHKFQTALMAALASVSITTLSSGTLAVATGAALLAGQQAQAGMATTTTTNLDDDTTYNGKIITMSGGGGNVSSRTYQQYMQNAEGTQMVDGAAGVYGWLYFANNKTEYGNTMRLLGLESGTKTYTSDFSPFSLGGLIVEAGAGTYTLGRSNTKIDFNGTSDVNLRIDGNIQVLANTSPGIEFVKGGKWIVAANKTLEFSTNQALVLDADIGVDISGGGLVKVTGKLDARVGATISVAGNTELQVTGTSTLGGTITNAGKVTFGGAVTLTSDLRGFDYEAAFTDYEESEGKGFAGSKKYTVINNTGSGSCELTQVTYNSQNYTLEGGKFTLPGATNYTTYYIQEDNASMDLVRAAAYAQAEGGVALGTVEVGGANATITVGSNQSLNTLNILGGKSATVDGSGTLTLANLSLGTGSTLGLAQNAHVTVTAKPTLSGRNITLATGSVLDLSGNSSDASDIRNIMGNVSGAGTVKINGAGERSFPGGGTTTLLTNLEFISSAEFNGTGWQNPAGHTFNVGNGTDIGSIKVTNDLRLESQMHINVKEGSSLTVGGNLIMGHTTAGNPGHVDVNHGTLTVGNIKIWDNTTLNSITLANSTVEATQAGNLFTYNGSGNTGDGTTVSATNVTLKATDVDWAWNRAIAFGGTLAVDAGSHTITLGAAEADFSVVNPITLTSGTVAFAGNWNLSGITHTGTTQYTGGKVEGTNGFASLVTSLRLVNMGTGTSIGSTSGAHFTIDGVTATLDATGLAQTSGDVDYDTFHVLTGSENVTQGRVGGTYNPVYSLDNGATLVVDADLTGAKLTRENGSTGNATLNIKSGMTYTSDGNEKHVTITGEGTYELTKTTASGKWFNAPMVDTLDATNWTGTVKLANMTKLGDLNLNNYGNAHSTVMLDNVTAYLNTTPFTTKLLLGSGGFTVVDGGSGSTYTFAGGVGGVGNFTINYTTTPSGMNFVFSGDVKDWTGSLVYNVNRENKVIFKGGATEVNATITRSQGTMNMEVGDGTAFTTTFKKAVGASTLTIKNNASATFKETLTLTGSLTLDGSATLEKGGSIGGSLDLSNNGAAHGTLTLAAGQNLTYGSSFWAANGNKLLLGAGATVKKATDAPIVIKGLAVGEDEESYVSSSTNGQLLLNNGNFTLHNVEATINTANDQHNDVQLRFDNSKLVTDQTITLKNLQSVFSGMDIQGGTTTVGASDLTESATVQLGAVKLSGGNLTLADHVIGTVNGMNVTASGTVTGGTLAMQQVITMGADATLTLTGTTVDVSALSGGGTHPEYVEGQHPGDGSGFSSLSALVKLVDFTAGGTVNEDGATFVMGTNTGTLILDDSANKGYVSFADASYNAYYLNNATATDDLSYAINTAAGHEETVLEAVYLNAGTLNADVDTKVASLHIHETAGVTPGDVSITGTAANFGTVSGNGTLNVDSATTLTADTLSIAADETLTFAGSEHISFGTITNHGTLDIGTGTKVATSNAITVGSGETFTTTGAGTLASSSTLTVQGGTATLGSKSEWSVISIGNGSLNINADTTVSGNFNVGTGNGERSGNITVAHGATLTANKLNTPWGFGSMTINGVFNATEQFSINTGAHEYQITGTGTINTKELIIQNQTTNAIFSGGLKINIGDNGIKGDQPLELRDVTVGVLGDSNGWSASRAITLGSADTGTTFNIGNGKTVTLSGAISGSGKLVKDGDGTLNLAYIINNNGYTGNIEVKDGTLTVKGTNGDAFHNVNVAEGATVEIIGTGSRDYRFRYTLDGGTLTSSGNATGSGNVQNDQITLTKSSTISGSANFYILGGSYGVTSLDLQTHTLTKEGTNTVSLINTDVSTGTIVVNEGTVEFYKDKTHSRVQANIELNGGTISGAYTYKASDSPVIRNLTAKQDVTVDAAIEIGNNVTLATSVDNSKTLTMTGAITGTGNFSLSGTGTLALGSSINTTGDVTVAAGSAITFANGATITANSFGLGTGSKLDFSDYKGSIGSEIHVVTTTNGVTGYAGAVITAPTAPRGMQASVEEKDKDIVLTFQAKENATMHLYILTGQSNSMGTSKDVPLPQGMLDAYSTEGGMLWNGNMYKATQASPGGSRYVENPTWQSVLPQLPEISRNGKSSLCMGPEYGFTYMMLQKGWFSENAENDSLGVMKASLDGGGNSFWVKDGSISNYALIVDSMQRAIEQADDMGYSTLSVDGLMYLQGESDGGDSSLAETRFAAFLENLTNDLNAWKQEQGIDVALVFSGNAVTGENFSNNTTSQIFLDAATSDDKINADKNGRGHVLTKDLEGIGDGLHFTGNSQLTIGARYAYAFAVQKGKDVGAVRGQDDSKTLDQAGAWWMEKLPNENEVATWDISSVSTVNNIADGATLTVGGIKIDEVYHEGATAQGQGSIAINGGAISLGAGGINLVGGDLAITSAVSARATQTWQAADDHKLAVNGTTTIATDAKLTLKDGLYLTFGYITGTGSLEIGTVTFDMDLDYMGAMAKAQYISSDGPGANGYVNEVNLIDLTAGDGTITFTHGGSVENIIQAGGLEGCTLTLGDGNKTLKVTMPSTAPKTVYFTRSGEVTYTSTDADENGIYNATELVLSGVQDSPATLTLSTALKSGVGIKAEGLGGTVNIVDGVTLAAASVNAAGGPVALTGEGEYVGKTLGAVGSVTAADVLGAGVTLASNWTGSVVLSGGNSSFSGHTNMGNLADFYKTGSTIVFNGMYGYFDNNHTISANIEFRGTGGDGTGAALTYTAGNNKTVELSGTVTGKGDFVFDKNGGNPDAIKFTGNISEWTGSITTGNHNSATLNLTFGGAVTDVNAAITKGQNHPINVTVDADDEVSFNAALTNLNSLTLNANKSASVLGGISTTATTLNGGASLTIGGTGTTNTLGTVTVGGANANLTFGADVTSVAVSNLTLNDNASLTLTNNKAGATLDLVTLNRATLTVQGTQAATATRMTVGDQKAPTLVLGQNLSVGQLDTMGALNTFTIKSAEGGEAKTLTAGTLDLANQETKIALQNVTLTVTGAATVGEVIERNMNNDTMLVGSGAILNLNGGVNWNHDGKYVDLVISNGGAVNVTDGAENTLHGVNLGAGSSLTFGTGTSTTIGGAVVLANTITNDGSVTLTGTVNLDALTADYEAEGYRDGKEWGNGFYVIEADVRVFTAGHVGTVNSGDATITFKNGTGTIDEDGLFHTEDEVLSTFYVKSDGSTENYTTAFDFAGELLTTVSLDDTTTINLDKDGAALAHLVLTEDASATVQVSENATIASVEGVGVGQTLTVAGTTGKVLTLSANNTMAGTVDVQSGTLKTTAATALGNAHVDVAAAGTLELGANLTLANGMDNAGTISMAGKTLTLNGQDGRSTYNLGAITGNDSTNLIVNANADAVFTGNATMHHVQAAANSTVTVAETATLTLTNTANRVQAANHSAFYALDNRGTISIKSGNGDLHLYGTGDGQVFNVGHLHIDGTNGTSYMLTAGSVNYTTDIVVKSLTGGSASHTLQVTDCYNGGSQGQVIDFIIGVAQDHSNLYEGKIQYGIGTGSALAGSGMNVVLKDELVASKAVLDTIFSGNNAQSATVTVDTDHAKVKGMTGTATATRTMQVRGTEAAENRVLEIVGNDNYTYGGKLGANLDVVHSGSGTQSFGGVDGFDGSIDVEAGTLNILNIAQATSVSAQDVTINNSNLGVYTNTTAAEENVGALTVKGTLTASGEDAKLNANLVMDAGSTLDVSAYGGMGGLNMGCTVTLNPGMSLSTKDMEGVAGLGFMEAYDLYYDVESFSIGEQQYSEITFASETWVKASEIFNNTELGAKDYYVFYSGVNPGGNGGNVGTIYIVQVPEPTTSTLSLLALCALAARRRRK